MSLHEETQVTTAPYLTVVAGKLRRKVEEGTPGAVLREGFLKDGTPYKKWELVYPGITGFIKAIEIKKGSFGKEVNITMRDENEQEYIVQLMATNKNTGVKFLSALPNIDLEKEVTIKPYDDFISKKDGKNVMGGMNILQDGEKIQSAFYDGKKKLLGMPEPEVDKRTKEVEWDTYWPIRDKFLQDYALDNGLAVYNDGTNSGAPATNEDDF